jgi:hypothetical protein
MAADSESEVSIAPFGKSSILIDMGLAESAIERERLGR